VFSYANVINETFEAWEHYIENDVQDKEAVIKDPNTPRSSRIC
jgi:hypothetical protein